MKRADLHTRLSYAVAWVRGRTDARPRIGLVLGSGLGGFAERLEKATVIPYAQIPEFPISQVPGHAGRLVIGELPGANPLLVATMQGRAHTYEGWTAEDASFGVRVLCQLGVRALVLTNASGAVNPELVPGALLRITDHLNLSGLNPLTGLNDERLGPRFPDLTHAYDPSLGEALEAVARRLEIPLARGIYACMSGPSYETPAEIRMLRMLGADCVGMSTVPEVIAARHMSVPVCAISVVTNRAAGLSDQPLTHEEVSAVAERAGGRLGALLAAFLPEVAR
jgi:purine-nucleoside phosphorylase